MSRLIRTFLLPPPSVSAVALSLTSARITWTAVTRATSYVVRRGTTTIYSGSALTFDDTGLALGTYSYTVASVGARGEGAPSSAANVTLADATAPTAPGTPSVANTSSSSLTVSWTAATDSGGSGLAGYRLERSLSPSSGFAQIVDQVGTSYVDTGLSASTTYYYRVRAYDGAGNVGAYSANGSGTTQAAAGGGSLAHGSVFSVTGGVFGTRPDYNVDNYTWQGQRHIHFRWTDYAGGEPVSDTKAGWLAATNGFYPNPVPGAVAAGVRVVAGGPSRSGKYSRRQLVDGNRIRGMSCDVTGAPNPLTQEYICLKFRMLGEGQSSGLTVGKWFRQYTSGAVTLILGPYVILRESSTPDFPQRAMQSPVSNAFHQNWNRWELDLDSAGSRFRANGTLIPGFHSTTGTTTTFPFLPGTDNVNGHTIDLPNMVDDTIVSSPYEYGFADIYIDFTRARVEITGANGKTEIQPVKSWTNGEIQIITNLGELSSGAGTLRAYNSAGTVIHTQSVTVP